MAKKATPAKSNKTSFELRQRILKNSKLGDTSMLADSIIFQKKDMIVTPVPLMNVALSGRFDGGLLPGSIMIAGPSKHFKTLFGLLLVSSFLKEHPDGVVLFYDSEIGTPKQYWKLFGIDEEAIIHCPCAVVEDMTTDLLNQLDSLKKGEPVLVLVDSIGNLASAKELDDALAGNEKSDMGNRAKKLKAMFRMITLKLNLKGVPAVIINHTYKTLELYSKDVTGGGTGPIYGANDIWIVGRQQDKDGKELEGFNFIINIEKSRTVKEKAKFPIAVSFEKGIQKWSGMFDLAVEAGIITSPTQGWYEWDGKKYRRDEIEYRGDFWNMALEKSNLIQYIENKYKLPDTIMVEETTNAEEVVV